MNTNSGVSRVGYDNLPEHVAAAGYERENVTPGIVHIGPGAFWSAHLAHYIHQYMARTGDLSWGFVVASLRSSGTIEALRASDHQFVLVERTGQDQQASVLAPVVDSIFAPENPFALVDAIADGAIKVLSLTVTNKGYYCDSTHNLDLAHADIVHDLNFTQDATMNGDAPRTIHWYLKAGLEKRMKEALISGESRTLTVMSLDNVRRNSGALKAAFIGYVQATASESSALVAWIEENVDFLCTMVDRITPAVNSEFRRNMEIYLGFDAGVVVGTENFRQLVIESGRFEMPAWECVGVEIVENIGPYWRLKFYGLNAAHQVPAMVGQRLGTTHIHEAMNIPEVTWLLEEFHRELGVILGDDLIAEYGAAIQKRFKDSAAMDTILRVGARGTSKASERILLGVERALNITAGEKVLKAATFVFACWMLNLGNTDERGNTFSQVDLDQPKLSDLYLELLAWLRSENRDLTALAGLLRQIGEIVRDRRFIVMASKTGFVTELAWALHALTVGDTRSAINSLRDRVEEEQERALMRRFHLMFDYDNTLGLTEGPAFQACCAVINGTLQRKGVPDSELFTPSSLMHRFVGYSFRKMIVELSAEHGFTFDDGELEALVLSEETEVIEKLATDIQPTEGVIDLLSRLGGFEMSVVSSSAERRVRACLVGAGQDDFFRTDRIYSAANYKSSKPEPRVYLEALAGMGLDPHNCLSIEDSKTGAQSAISAGITVLGYLGAYPPKEQEAIRNAMRDIGVKVFITHWNQFEAALASLASKRFR